MPLLLTRRCSTCVQVRVEIESLAEGVDLSEPLTRARFEELVGDLLKKTLGPVRKARSQHLTLHCAHKANVICCCSTTHSIEDRQVIARRAYARVTAPCLIFGTAAKLMAEAWSHSRRRWRTRT